MRNVGKGMDDFVDFLYKSVGQKISIEEQIALNGPFDSPFATYVCFTMTLGKVGGRYSGAKLALYGADRDDVPEKNENGILYHRPESTYEISLDLVEEYPVPASEIVFIEKYSEKITRRTIIKGLLV